MISVRLPSFDLRDAFLRMLDDYAQYEPENGEFYSLAKTDYAGYVDRLDKDEKGIDLPEGIVQCSHRWLVVGEDVVGVVRVRHHIDTPLLYYTGHIGYDIAPSFRRRGYGLRALVEGLNHCRELGITQVLVCADAENPPSWRVIERGGGVLENEIWSDHWDCLVRRYWFNTAKG